MIDATREIRIAETFRAFEDEQTDQRKQDILDILEDDDEQVQTAALQMLTGYAEKPGYAESLLPSIVARTTDPEPKVRNAAGEVMSRLAKVCIDEDRPIAGLEDLLTHDADDARRDALHGVKMAGERHPGVLADHLPTLTDRLSDPDAEIRCTAALVLGYVAEVRPDEVADVTPVLVDRLKTDDILVKNAVVQALANISTHRPRAVIDAIPALRSELDADVIDPGPMIETLANVAEVAPGSICDVSGALVDVATGPTDREYQNGKTTSMEMVRENDRRLSHETTRANAVRALGSIGEYDPDMITPRVEAVTPLLSSDVPSIRESAIDLFRTLGTERPRTMETIVPALLEQLEEAPTEAEWGRTQKILIEFGDASPSEFARVLERTVEQVIELLSHDDSDVRGAAAGFLSYVAERDPTAVPATNETLIELLDDSDPVVRGNAALVLGTCGSDDARDALASLDPDEEFVDDAVEQALARLER